MTDLMLHDPGNGAVVQTQQPPAFAANSALVLWAYEARQAAQIATSLAKTSFVPASLRGKPEDITAAILAGQELGLRPMATLRSMDVIQGTPALRAHAMRGLVQSHGHQVQLGESTETRCRMRGRRRGEEEWQIVTWTIERATKLGLTGKEQWRKQPQTMLMARATGEICRLIASDVLHAMPYAVEELTDDMAPVAAPDSGAVEPPWRRTARRAPLVAPAPPPPDPEPDFDEPAQAPAERPAGRGITDTQRRHLHALVNELGYDRDAKLGIASEIIGRPIDTTNDLSQREAALVIAEFEKLAGRDDEPMDAGWPDVATPPDGDR